MKSHSGNAVKVYLWVSGLATAMFPFFAPENLGGGGNIRKKAEEEAIHRARREIVRIRGVEEKGVLGDLISGEDVKGKVERTVPVTRDIMDDSEDEDMDD